jgi:Leucine-rich repeat (LRR) protein
MGRLTGLKKLDLSICSGLTALPEWMGRLTGLQELDLSCCFGLTAPLPVVKELRLSGVHVRGTRTN